MLGVDSLRCFVEAARLLNFRAAARAVALSPASLGQRIRQLEDQLGAPLFHRTTRAVVLTQSGLALLPYAERALSALDDCERAGKSELGPSPVDIVLGTRHELGVSWILPMLDKIKAAQPHLTTHLYFGSGPDLVLRVRSLAIDCAVTSTRLTDPKLDSIRLHEERYVFVGEPRLLAKTPFKTAEHAHLHTLIDTTDELPLFRYWRDAPGGVDSLNFSQILRMGTIAAIREVVLRGQGVAVLPEYFVQNDLKSKKLVRILARVKPLPDYFRLVFRADDPRRSVYAKLAETMITAPLR